MKAKKMQLGKIKSSSILRRENLEQIKGGAEDIIVIDKIITKSGD